MGCHVGLIFVVFVRQFRRVRQMFSSISSFFSPISPISSLLSRLGDVAFDPFYSDFRMGFWVWCAGCGDSGAKGWRAVWCAKDGKRARRERWGLGARFPALCDWHLSILQCQGSDHLFFFPPQIFDFPAHGPMLDTPQAITTFTTALG